jgi:hypothetical protein
MRNPFRKRSPEEEFVESFLRGMKGVGNQSEEGKAVYALIKSLFDEGDYVAAQKLANEFTQAAAAAFRAEKDKKF